MAHNIFNILHATLFRRQTADPIVYIFAIMLWINKNMILNQF